MAPHALITSIRLENFKAFIDTGRIPLKPITLLVGKNSAGKSSLIKAILGASQTSRQPRLDNSYFRLIGDYTNLGTYRDTVHGNDIKTNFSVGFEVFGPGTQSYDNIYSFRYSFSRNETDTLGTSLQGVEAYFNKNFICSGRKPIKKRKNEVVRRGRNQRLSYPKITDVVNFPEGSRGNQRGMSEMAIKFREAVELINERDGVVDPDDIEFSDRLYIDDFALDIDREAVNGETQYPFWQTSDYFKPRIGAVEGASFHLDRILANTIYLGPLRDEPTREARLAQSSGNKIGIRGEDLATMLHQRQNDSVFMGKFNSHLQSSGVADSARTEASYMKNADGKEVETGFIKILLEHEGYTRSLMDLGFGTSQVLPIIFELSLRTRSLIVLEQPELHLHPAAQSEIGGILNFSIKQNNQLIVETHSANLIERLKRLIREGELDNNDVNIIYIGKDEDHGGSRCDVIGFDEKGEFTETWPEESFFGERELEYLDW